MLSGLSFRSRKLNESKHPYIRLAHIGTPNDHVRSSTSKSGAAVITVSDSCASGQRVDQSGTAVVNFLKKTSFEVIATKVVPDDQAAIQNAILELSTKSALIITTGGTGIAPRDVTPEATRVVCDRLIEGIPERMRSEGSKKTPFAVLSRGLCGICGTSLVLNLPGSPKGAVESLEAVIDLLPHALQLVNGNTEHGDKQL